MAGYKNSYSVFLLYAISFTLIARPCRSRAQDVLIHIHVLNECTYATGHFDGKPMPSAGPLPFLQGFLCTSNNTCHDTMTPDEMPGMINDFDTSL